MKNLLKLTFLNFALVSLNCYASMDIKNIVLRDSTVVEGTEVSAINLYENNSKIESIETFSGDIIKGTDVQKINIFKPFSRNTQTIAKVGGEGSGF